MNDIESRLKQLPKFKADTLFKDILKQQVLREVNRHTNSWVWLPRVATVTAAVFIIVFGIALSQKYRPPPTPDGNRSALDVFKAAPVSAAEIIQNSIAKFFSPGTIYHSKVKQFIAGTLYTSYEDWDDLDSDMFYEEITYPDGRKVIQGLNKEFRWNIDFQARMIQKDIYVYDSPYTVQPVAVRADLSQTFKDLLQSGTLTAEEQMLDGRAAYLIRDSRTGPAKTWDVLYFDRETFALLRTDKLSEEGKIQDSLVYELQESLPRTEENMADIFRYQKPAGNFAVYERHLSVTSSYQDDYKLVEGVPLSSLQPVYAGEASPIATPSAITP